jgi:hypothetical protein
MNSRRRSQADDGTRATRRRVDQASDPAVANTTKRNKSPWETTSEVTGVRPDQIGDLVLPTATEVRLLRRDEIKMNSSGAAFATLNSALELIAAEVRSNSYLLLIVCGPRKKQLLAAGIRESHLNEVTFPIRDPLAMGPEFRTVTLCNLGDVCVTLRGASSTIEVQCKPTSEIIFEVYEEHCEDHPDTWKRVSANNGSLRTMVMDLMREAGVSEAPEVSYTKEKFRTLSGSYFLKARVLVADLDKALATSGKKAIFNHEIVPPATPNEAYSVHWMRGKSLKDLNVIAQKITVATAMVVNRYGLGLRFKTADTAAVRQVTCLGDTRYDDNNRHLNPRHYYEVAGFPQGTPAAAVTGALQALGWLVLPIRRRDTMASTTTWIVGSENEQKKERFEIKTGWLLVVPCEEDKKSKTASRPSSEAQAMSPTSPASQFPPTTPVSSVASGHTRSPFTPPRQPQTPEGADSNLGAQLNAVIARVTKIEAGYKEVQETQHRLATEQRAATQAIVAQMAVMNDNFMKSMQQLSSLVVGRNPPPAGDVASTANTPA